MKKRIRIDGMSCDNCVRHVTVALKDLDGVSEVITLIRSKPSLSLRNPGSDIIDAIEEVGYEVVGIEEI